MNDELLPALFALLTLCFGIYVGILVIPTIEAYEVAHSYPFGKLCEVYKTCQ